jgi:hypothetical protein
MSVEDELVIDAIGGDDKKDEVVLLITDHLDWSEASINEHLYKLQKKINTYINFFESGDIYNTQSYLGKSVVIEIAFKFELSEKGKWFIEQVEPVLESIGINLRYRVG